MGNIRYWVVGISEFLLNCAIWLVCVNFVGCSFVYTKSGEISASAQSLSNISLATTTRSEYSCTYFVTTTDSSETVILELSAVNGFSDTSRFSMECSPRLDIYSVGSSGKENRVARLCRDDDVKLPKVFRISTSLAKIVFVWPSDKKTAEFKINFSYSGIWFLLS